MEIDSSGSLALKGGSRMQPGSTRDAATGYSMHLDRNRAAALDMAKGILIACIVLAHNRFIVTSVPGSKAFFYNWHVYAFLIIPFLLPFRADVRGFIATRLVRYGIPFVTFTFWAWIVKIVTSGVQDSLGKAIYDLVVAALLGSADLLDRACGARLFWFLPTLLGLTLVRYAGAQLGKIGAAAIVLVSLVSFPLVGLIPRSDAQYFPLGLPIVFYILLPGLVFQKLMEWAWVGSRARISISFVIFLSIFIAAYWLSLARGTSLALDLFRFYDIRDPIALLDHAVIGISATCALVFGASLLPRVNWLAWYGQGSLIVYLTHQFVFVSLTSVVKLVSPGLLVSHRFIVGMLVYAGTLAMCGAMIWLVNRRPGIRRLVMPRDWREWRYSFAWRRA